MTQVSESTMKKKKIALLLATLVAIAFLVMEPFTGLTDVGMKTLGIFIWWMVALIVNIYPMYAVTFAALVVMIATGVTTYEVAFSGFANSTPWLLIGALGMAACLQQSGFLRRLALNIMKFFPGTFTGQSLGMAFASLILAPAIPSTTAKSAVLIPITNIVSDELGYENSSRGAVGIFSLTNSLTHFGSFIFLTGGITPLMIAAVSGVSMTFMSWLKTFIVYGAVYIGLTIIFHLFYYNPKKDGNLNTISKDVLVSKCQELGKMSKQEWIALAVLVVTILLWMTEGTLHSVPTQVVAIGAWSVMVFFGLFPQGAFETKLMWELFTFLAAVLGVITVFMASGAATWLGSFTAPVVIMFSDSPAVLIIVMSLIGFVGIMFMVYGAVTGAICMALLSASTISPLVVIAVVYFSSSTFIYPFQQVIVLASEAMSGGKVQHSDIVPAAIAHQVIVTISLIATIPWWSALGLL